VTVDRARVGDVLRLERRAVAVDPQNEYEEIGVRSFGRGIFHKPPVSGADLGSKRVFRVTPGDLVISNVFAWEGAIAVASDREIGKIGSHRFMTFVPASNRIDVPWAAWFFRSEPGLELIRKASPGSAGRNRTLAIDRFEQLEIPIPPIDVQCRVAERLNHAEMFVDRLRDGSERAVTLNAALAVSLATRPDLTAEAKFSSGWRKVNLGTVMQIATDRVRIDASCSYPNVGVYSFGRGLFKKAEIDGAATSASTLSRIRAGQFIYSRLFAFEGAYAHVPPEFDGFHVSNEFPTFNADGEQLNAQWLAISLRSPQRWHELAGRSKGLGVRRQRVPAEAILDYEAWVPPRRTQDEMVAAIEELETAGLRRQGVTTRVDALVPAILNQAFASAG
jgi:type I restriction enzyme, S subunit